MAKIQKISQLQPTLGFTEFDIYESYRQSFYSSELGKLHQAFPFSDFSWLRHAPPTTSTTIWVSGLYKIKLCVLGGASQKHTIFTGMFIRKKRNRSGTTGIVVVDKSRGFYKEVITIGVSKDETEIAQYYEQAKNWITAHNGTRDIFNEQAKAEEEEKLTKYFLSNVENILLNGTQLILEQVFRLVGFDRIDDEILKHLVVARISQPSSKAG